MQSPVIIKRNQLHKFSEYICSKRSAFFPVSSLRCAFILKRKKNTSAEQREVSCQQTGFLRRVNKECFSEVETEVVDWDFHSIEPILCVCLCFTICRQKESYESYACIIMCLKRRAKKKNTANWVIGIPVAIAMAMMGLTSSYREAVKVTPKVLSQAACSVFLCALSSKQC